MLNLSIFLTGPKKPAVRENRILGQLKLTLHYQRGAFMVSENCTSLLIGSQICNFKCCWSQKAYDYFNCKSNYQLSTVILFTSPAWLIQICMIPSLDCVNC